MSGPASARRSLLYLAFPPDGGTAKVRVESPALPEHPDPALPCRRLPDVLALFATRWPPAFTMRRPLAVGIHHAVLADHEFCAAHDLYRHIVRAALHRWTSHPSYLKRLIEGTPRIDLAGYAVSRVSAAQAAMAKTMLQNAR